MDGREIRNAIAAGERKALLVSSECVTAGEIEQPLLLLMQPSRSGKPQTNQIDIEKRERRITELILFAEVSAVSRKWAAT